MKTGITKIDSVGRILVLISLLIIFFLFNTLRNENLLSNNGYCLLTVLSDSMSPILNTGDLVLVKRHPAKIKVGDIITFRIKENILVTHRVIQTHMQDGKILYITKGDANKDEDQEFIGGDRLFGLYKATIPKIGYVLFASNYLRQNK